VLRGSLEESALRHRRPKLTGCKMKWSKAAIKWILNVHSSQRSKVIQAVEEKATRFNKKGIDSISIFDIKPPFNVIFPNSTNFEYSPHSGPITSIDTSPFHKNLFLSCSMDSQLRLYHTLQQIPIAMFEPSISVSNATGDAVLDAKFSPTKPTILAAASSHCIYFYGMELSPSSPHPLMEPIAILTPPSSCTAVDRQEDKTMEQKRPYSMHAIAFNKSIQSLFAAGDSDGMIHVWKLPQQLTCNTNKDTMMLNDFVSTLCKYS